MGRAANYFIGMLFSRMSIYAYGIGSSVTTAIFYLLYLEDILRIHTRVFEAAPLILELFLRVAFPFWVPPITRGNVLAFLLNVFFGFIVLLYWTAKYDFKTPKWRKGRR